MPAKMSLGLSKKVGLPAYSSIGASCQVECEIDRSILEDGTRFRQEAQRLFDVCQQAIEDQLARETATTGEPRARINGCSAPTTLSNADLSRESPQSAGEQRHANKSLIERGLSERQLAFLQDLASQIDGLGIRRLPALVAFQCDKNLTELTSAEASQLIGLLRQVRAGKLSLESLLEYEDPAE